MIVRPRIIEMAPERECDEPIEMPRCTLEEAGKKPGLTKEGARLAENRAFAKLWEGLQEVKMSELFGPDSVV